VKTRSRRDPKTIPAVHEDDQMAVLERLAVLDEFKSGALVCSICDRPLKDAGIGAVRKVNDRVVFSCSAMDCIRDITEGQS
jgi:hypothetical protein